MIGRTELLCASDRVALGRYPRAPTDAYVHALVHTVLQIRVSLRGGKLTERYTRGAADTAEGGVGACSN